MSQHTRQKRQAQIDSIMEIVDQDKLCIIPSSLFRLVLDDHMMLQEKAIAINDSMAKTLDANSRSLETIAGHMEKVANSVEILSNNASQDTLLEKLDNLTAAITSTNLSMASRSGVPSVDQNCNKLLQERFTLTQKIYRDERLCQIYTEGLAEEIQFAPSKFRAHVGPNALENEKKHLRAKTIFEVQTQMKIMQDAILDWRKRINDIDVEIEVGTAGNETLKETVSTKITTQEEAARAKVEKESIAKVLETYNKEKTSGGPEFLLTERVNENPKNFRGRGRGRGTRRGK